MTVLIATHPRFWDHQTGTGHPERSGRLDAVAEGVAAAVDSGGVDPEAIVSFLPTPAPMEAVLAVHTRDHIDGLSAAVANGGGRIDPDTVVSAHSVEAALLAAGAGLDAVARLEAGEGVAAFCAVRPPGHHATPRRAMGFCLLNNVAVTARSLADRGERVLIVDIDALHGNGTQDAFYSDPAVRFVSLHQYPFYPGTGAIDDIGAGAGLGATVNIALPASTEGAVYRDAIDRVVVPLADVWHPTWVLVSAGFDAHRRDPLTDMGLTDGDYADIVMALVKLAPLGRIVCFLEGGYDPVALSACTSSTVSALAGVRSAIEAPTSGGAHAVGSSVVDQVLHLREDAGVSWR